ncbi:MULTISPECIES: TFIIB-type zinc finger domain-containing protein [unclassified Ruegeria]|uniref:TFIIB-type zinc finger domain-containing protein n=1 Tax=unclassified Ruegeria TaxID=2625375 RepID=UPI00148838C8|nr:MULTISPECIES: TFIIB-type zinc finger domain-containing protein [unclassified Ruegeria]NOD34602.1 primosomal protein N' (replication factor Y) - superfamily II helicase [Ruegeria sp. HKCCD7296]NOE34852.1 primosomal protein N' (replication factor Y) - superfamily II helicase [Ruegeria sp. HKCCD7318]NOE41928.1 primosomal protein N' (replication factor Y) - superfamily II helicase [Ruegeria sp. HKCCD7319]
MTHVTAPDIAEHRFPCDQCGADYRFNPGDGTLTCDHCGHSEPISAGPWGGASLRELDFDAAIADRLPDSEIEETRVLSCPNCAAQVEFDPNTHAAECPFCATPVVTDTGINRHIKPKGVLPFAFDERSAHKAMGDWLGRLWFAPNGLKEYARKGRKMQGIYVPYWTFDADTKSSYRGERGTVYYETRTVMRDGKRVQQQVPKVRWTPKSGRVARFFDDVLVLASKSLPKSYTDALEPWDLPALEPYQPEYLAGFRAEAYSVELREGYVEARAHMARVIERDVRFDIGGDRQRIHAVDTDVRDVTFKHILLPVWMAAYKYRGQTYRFVVNGRTGRVQGERPWSAIKITIAVVLGLLLAAGVGYLAATGQ